MAVRYDETEYTYISAKVRALENSLVSRAELSRMLAAKDSTEAFAVLRDRGLVCQGRVTASGCEDILLTALKNGLDALGNGLPAPDMLKVFEYPYDCSNIKSAIKCGIRGIDCMPLMFETGSVPAKTAAEAVEKRDFSVFPKNMAQAAQEAVDTYGKTKNPQKIDFILDRACFADLAELAKALKIPFITKLCRSKADLTNYLICLRVLRMKCGAYGEKLIEEAMVPGGVLGTDKFAKAFSDGEGVLFTLIGKEYPFITDNCRVGDDPEKIERVVDDYRLSLAKTGKYTTFGAEIPAAYIIALENEIQNIRIILAGKDSGLDDAKTEERLRDCYV